MLDRYILLAQGATWEGMLLALGQLKLCHVSMKLDQPSIHVMSVMAKMSMESIPLLGY